MPFVGTIDYYNKSHKVEKRPSGGHKEFFMESVIAIFMVVSVMVLSVYFANWIKGSSDEKHQKLNDIFTFSLPCVATMAIGIAVISDILLLPIVITAALLAGTLSLLVSLTEEQKYKQSKADKVDLRYIVFVVLTNGSITKSRRMDGYDYFDTK